MDNVLHFDLFVLACKCLVVVIHNLPYFFVFFKGNTISLMMHDVYRLIDTLHWFFFASVGSRSLKELLEIERSKKLPVYMQTAFAGEYLVV